MKKYTMIMIAVAAFVFAACQPKQPANQETAKTTETAAAASVTPEKIKALVDAEWDSVPQAVLDDLGFKALKLFK
jgi:PBP1b-binding outer membrane lipoprotein LpoB